MTAPAHSAASSRPWDAIIIGAGAAGLFCAGVAGQRGLRVLVLDQARTLGEKIRISGGGYCNFTNTHSGPGNFLSLNPHFVKGPLARYTPADFVSLVKRHRIPFHEKHRGQLFCDGSARAIIDLLQYECAQGGVTLRHPVSVTDICREGKLWRVQGTGVNERSHALVLATGGLPVPALGSSDFALSLAKQFSIPVVAPRPALVPLALTAQALAPFAELSGLSLPVILSAGVARQRYGQARFEEDLLITHKGLSGPAMLQASSYWQEGESLELAWLAESRWAALAHDESQRLKNAESLLARALPQRLAAVLCQMAGVSGKRWAEVGKKDRARLTELVTQWSVKPAGTLGWKKAEVMLGGVDTRALDSRSLMAREHPGLHFIGECVDVTGHLGGHNFQWAWASGFACAQSLKTG
ncbi:MAG: aminoacetone oxidase family FAD-binding enzyme [Betaproteobacteria bacterium]|nr:aminoacetone oxidase family FAD-binding enzyme [Betaproteobacteria bacterium]